MALVKINGVELPTPSKYEPGIMDINKVDRNARGDMMGDRINTKRKLEMSWNTLSAEHLSQLFNLVAPLFFQVEYIDPQDNGMRSGTFYAGDRSCGMISFINGIPKYKDIKFNIIEK